MEEEKVKVEMVGGKRVYRNDSGEELETYSEDVDFMISVALEPLRDFLDMSLETSGDSSKIGFIGEALLQRAEQKIHAAMDFLNENFGRIRIEGAVRGHGIEGGTMLGVLFDPCKKA